MVDYHGIGFLKQSNVAGTTENDGRSVPSNLSLVKCAVSTTIICVSLSACSVSGPKTALLESDAKLVTGSVSRQVESTGIESTDTDVIKSTVAKAKLKPQANIALAWVNPDTGSSGTITTIDNFLGNHGQRCRGFKTTVSTFMGIAFYNGEACQISPSEWVLSWFRPVDSKAG